MNGPRGGGPHALYVKNALRHGVGKGVGSAIQIIGVKENRVGTNLVEGVVEGVVSQ